MSPPSAAFVGADIFDGTRIFRDHALLVHGAAIAGIMPASKTPPGVSVRNLDGGCLAPGFVDLQVNGGGGVMFNDEQSVDALTTIAAAHAALGATSILPTLITDTAARTRAAITAVEQAITANVPGIAGLHLEGPHLSRSRKGAHAASLIRPMDDADLALLVAAADRLPTLKVTIAPENVSVDQMRALSSAGAILSLGHSDAGFADCLAAVAAGVNCVTHLFNAMSQMGNREPGLVGAVLESGNLNAGLIADLVHVHPRSIAAALRAKRGPGQVFLVSDAMATAGSDIDRFDLNGRTIERHGGKLTLADGTLAGAHLELATAVANMSEAVGVPRHRALAMATSIPATVIGRQSEFGHLATGRVANFIHLDGDGALSDIWVAGREVDPGRG